LLKWGIKNNFPVISQTLNVAAESGNLDLVRYLINKGCYIDKRISTSAIQSCNVEMVKYFKVREYRFYCDRSEVLSTSIEMVKYVFDCVNLGKTTNTEIIEQGRLEIVEYFAEKGTIFDTYDFNTALLCGHVNVAKYIRFRMSDISPESIKRLVSPVCDNDKLPELLSYCYELICQGFNYISFAAKLSVRLGDIEFIRWLNNDTKTKYGQTSPSKYIFEYKDFVKLIDDENLLESAITHRYIDLVKYLLEQGCYRNSKWTYMDHNILKFFLENKYELDDDIFAEIVSFGSSDSIMLLLSHSIPYKLDGLLGRACGNSLDIAILVESLGGNFDGFDISRHLFPLEKLKWINGYDVMYNGKFYKGCKTPITTNNNIQLYFDYGYYNQVEFLISLNTCTKNITFDSLFEYDEKGKKFEIFKLLLRSGYSLTKDTVTDLIKRYPKHEINIWLFDTYPKLFEDY
jgi:ankyrin repeat protein